MWLGAFNDDYYKLTAKPQREKSVENISVLGIVTGETTIAPTLLHYSILFAFFSCTIQLTKNHVVAKHTVSTWK